MSPQRPVLSVFAFAIACTAPTLNAASAPTQFNGSTPLEWSVRYANSEVARLAPTDELAMPHGRWNYATFMFMCSLLQLDSRLGEQRFMGFTQPTVDSFLSPDGKTIKKYDAKNHSVDEIAPGMTLLYLHKLTGNERYRNAIQQLRDQIDSMPRTSEGGFWHKQRYPYQMWLDGLYMLSPFFAEYTMLFTPAAARAAFYDDIAKQIRLIAKHTYDEKTGLYHHAWDEARKQDWADKTTGKSPHFWSRGIGWYAMSLVDVLDFLPGNTAADKARRAEVIAQVKRLVDGIIRWQDSATGLWWQVTDQGARAGNYLEATSSAMFAYTMAKAMNKGYLDRAAYIGPATKAYGGIVNVLLRVNPNGSIDLSQCCQVAGLGGGRDGSYEYYLSEAIIDNDPKGSGPFILAGIQLDQLLGINQATATLPPTPACKLGSRPAPPPERVSRAERIAGGPRVIPADPWDALPAILDRIKPPTFPDRKYPITEYGAPTDGKGDSSAAIRKAIEACHNAGGGTVLVPAGKFLTGPIHLKSNVNLHLADGATLLFHTDPDLYLPPVLTRWEGVECMNYSPLIYAYEQENIAITGKGTLDGQAGTDNWWAMHAQTKPNKKDPNAPRSASGRADIMRHAIEPIEKMDPAKRIYGNGGNLRPPFIQPYKCNNILIEGITILRSPFWEINPVLCRNTTIRGLNISSHGPNNDGIDPESCTDMLIEKTTFDTGDDCIAIKSGRNNDGRRINQPSENIIIRDCIMKDGHGGVAIGSEISGGCRNIFIENCRMDSPNLNRALRIKTNAQRGGLIENINLRNIQVGRVADAVLRIDFWYEEGDKGPHMPTVRGVTIENVTSQSSPRALYLKGFVHNPIRGVTMRNCTFNGVEDDDLVEAAENFVRENVTINRVPGYKSADSKAAKKKYGKNVK